MPTETRSTGELKRAGGIVWYVYRSSITGHFVSEAYALKNPDTTVREKRVR